MTAQSTEIDLEEIFSVNNEGEYTLLFFKKPNNKVIIYDPGLYHTAICKSKLSKVDTLDGRLFYRNIPVTEKIHEDFLDVAGEILFGETIEKAMRFKQAIRSYFYLMPEQKAVIDSLPTSTHPMDVLSISILSLSSLEKKYLQDPLDIAEKAGFITSQVAIAVSYYLTKRNQTSWIEPHLDLPYAERILCQMHENNNPKRLNKLGKILNTIMILHAEHGLNCSAATVRNVASARGSIYSAISNGS